MKKLLLSTVLLSISICSSGQLVSTIAGTGSFGSQDDSATYASFRGPQGICTDPLGNVYVADVLNHKIRKISKEGWVTTFAGSGTGGFKDTIALEAMFGRPSGICRDNQGNFYVADYGNNKIRMISSDGKVTTFAGSGIAGSADGLGDQATFNAPTAICIDKDNNIYVADYLGNKIRKISPQGMVTTLAGSGDFNDVLGTGSAASFNYPSAICIDNNGNLYVADQENHKIKKVSPVGVVTHFAGTGILKSEDSTVAIYASFYTPDGITIDQAGNIYVVDYNGNKVRKISTSGIVSTYAGDGTSGAKDGIGKAASFNGLAGICIDSEGSLFVTDFDGSLIRKISVIISTNTPSNATAIIETCVYPNPSNDGLIHIKNSNGIKIFNTYGQIIYVGNATELTLERGIYFVLFETTKGSATQKVIVN